MSFAPEQRDGCAIVCNVRQAASGLLDSPYSCCHAIMRCWCWFKHDLPGRQAIKQHEY